MREYMKIRLQYSIKSVLGMDKKEKKRELFTASQSKSQSLEKEKEREEEEEKTREGKKKKEDSRRKLCVYISLLPSVHNIPLSLTIQQQYQISSLATFFGKSSKHLFLFILLHSILSSLIVSLRVIACLVRL